MDFDIWNHESRKIVCVDNVNDKYGWNKNAELLTIGQEYTVCRVKVHDWHTRVELVEFPGLQFNSVLFEEVGGCDDDE